MKIVSLLFAALLGTVSAHGNNMPCIINTEVPNHRLDMISHIVESHNGTIVAPESVKCDICHYALEKAYSYGCGKAGGIIADLCGDFAPLCYAALSELCRICEKHCDVEHIIDDVCRDVHLCPSAFTNEDTTTSSSQTSNTDTSSSNSGSSPALRRRI